jgi:hypothetical protein
MAVLRNILGILIPFALSSKVKITGIIMSGT